MGRISLIFIVLFASCSVFKKVQKTETKEETKSDVVASEKTDIEKEKESTITTVITEKAAGTVDVPESNISGEWNFGDWEMEDDKQKITIDKNGKVKGTVKPQTIPVVIDKTTTKKEDIKEKETVKSDSSGREKKSQVSEDKSSSRDIKRVGLPWWLWILIVLIVLGALVWRFRKKLFI